MLKLIDILKVVNSEQFINVEDSDGKHIMGGFNELSDEEWLDEVSQYEELEVVGIYSYDEHLVVRVK